MKTKKYRACGEPLRVVASFNCPDLGKHDYMVEDTPKHTKVLHGLCKTCGHYGEDCTGSKPQHTPTPWKVHHKRGYRTWLFGPAKEEIGIMYSDDDTAKANAAYIVRAVNAHEELLDACKYVLKHWNNPGIAKQIVLKKAIAKAEAK